MLRAISGWIALSMILIASTAMGADVQWEKDNGTWKASETLLINLGSAPQLDIQDFAGDVFIQGEDRTDVEVTLVYHAPRMLAQDTAIERYQASKPTVDTHAATLSITGTRQRNWNFKESGWYEVVLAVPGKIEANVNTAGGDLEVTGVEGHLVLATAGGDVDVTGTKGRLTLSTAGGDVKVRDHTGTQNLTSSGGDVSLTDDTGLVTVSTSGGDVDLNSVSGRLAVDTAGGDIMMSNIDAQRAKVDVTGGQLHVINATCSELSTFSCHGGDIFIENTTGPLEMEVSGGDIEVIKHDGSVIASSTAGDVTIEEITGALEVNLNAGDLHASLSETAVAPFLWDLNINTGDVTLGIPAGAKVDLSASVNNWGGRTSIQSDYPLTKSEEGNSTTARCTLNGGGSDIHVSVGGGEIRIEKI